jgi:hypothetical protein
MKRDKQLMYYLLLQARDGRSPPELAPYPEQEQVYNAALLVEDGYVHGDALRGHDGNYMTVVLENLTSRGHDLLEEMEQSNPWMTALTGSSQSQVQSLTIAVFVSHSSKDKRLAAALVDLLRTAVGLTEKEIRCTSVDGYRFEVGAETDAQLKKEVKGSKVFIGLITPASIQSAYVLFELGARWGADLHLAPILASGADSDFLRGPLRGLNALNATSEAEMHQLISDIVSRLGRQSASPAVYGNMLKAFVAAASLESSTKELAGPSTLRPPKATPPSRDRSQNIPKEVADQIRQRAAKQFPTDFSTQKFVIESEIKAWRDLQDFSAPGVPEHVVQLIFDRASVQFPNDFSTQMFVLQSEVAAWKDLNA